jgi:hypothetical protein
VARINCIVECSSGRPEDKNCSLNARFDIGRRTHDFRLDALKPTETLAVVSQYTLVTITNLVHKESIAGSRHHVVACSL